MPPSEGGEVCCAWYHWLLYFEDKNFLWLPREGLLCLRRLCAAEARYILCLKNIPSLTGYSFNTHPPVFFNNLLHVISRHSKIDCRYNFLNYLAFYPPFASRAKGEVFVLLYVFLFFCFFLFGQRFLDNPQADSRQSSHAGVLWFRMCLLPFWGLAAPGGRKKWQMKFSLLWESMGNFCILAVFERYLSNACTDPHQILFV